MKRTVLQLLALAALSIAVGANAQVSRVAPATGPGFAPARPFPTSDPAVRMPQNGPINFNAELPASVEVPGATAIGVSTKYHLQTNGAGLHNIQVDPTNPMHIYAAVMAAPNVTVADTVAQAYPQRNVFYVYSADGGQTWTTPVAVSETRAGFPTMALRPVNGSYQPVIALHRFTTEAGPDLVTSVYIGTGDPSAETFTKMDATRTSAAGDTKDIIWPNIAVSPSGDTIYAVASINYASGESPDVLQFGRFVNDNGTWTFSGWLNGPNNNGGEALATAGRYVIRCAKSGMLGVVWAQADPSYGALFYSSSTDGGNNWQSDNTTILNPGDFPSEQSGGTGLLFPTDEDLQFIGDVPNVAISAYDYTYDPTAGSYVPASGTLLYWNSSMDVPVILLSRTRSEALNTGDFLSDWVNSMGTNPQGYANITHLSMGTVADSGLLAIYYSVWANNDSSAFYPIAGDTLPYFSIYRSISRDAGTTWGDPEPVLTNEVDQTTQKYDYRYPQLSSAIPVTNGSYNFPLMFAADTAAGIADVAGIAGWDELGWYYLTQAVSGVEEGTPSASLELRQNYPNPFATQTQIAFTLSKPSFVTLNVEDMMGRTYQTLTSGSFAIGEHSVKFDAGKLPAGIYRYVLQTNEGTISKSMTLLK